MKKQKILIENHLIMNGGTENVLLNMVNFLRQRDGGSRYDITVAAIPRNYQDFHTYLPAGVRFVQREKIRKGYKRNTLPWLIDTLICRIYDSAVECWLNLQHFDVTIANNTGGTMKRDARIRAKHKYCWVQRDFREYLPWGSSYAFRTVEEEFRCMKPYEKVVCVSESAKDGIIETMGDPGNLCVKYNPINAYEIRRLAKEPCPAKKAPGKFLIVAMGRLHPEKQFDLLLRLSKSLSVNRELEVWILGEGEEREKLETYIEREGLSFVKLMGFQPNPYSFMRQADLFVSCSSSESYGLSVQESLVLNVPVAAIRCSGIEESLDLRFGALVENDYEKMEAALKKLLDDPAKLKAYRENIEKYFSVADLYENRMESICALWEKEEQNHIKEGKHL